MQRFLQIEKTRRDCGDQQTQVIGNSVSLRTGFLKISVLNTSAGGLKICRLFEPYYPYSRKDLGFNWLYYFILYYFYPLKTNSVCWQLRIHNPMNFCLRLLSQSDDPIHPTDSKLKNNIELPLPPRSLARSIHAPCERNFMVKIWRKGFFVRSSVFIHLSTPGQSRKIIFFLN